MYLIYLKAHSRFNGDICHFYIRPWCNSTMNWKVRQRLIMYFESEDNCLAVEYFYVGVYYLLQRFLTCCCLAAKSCPVRLLCDLIDCSQATKTRLLCPWDFLGKKTGVDCHFLLQGVFLTQWLNWSLLHWQVDSLPLSHLGSPSNIYYMYCLFSPKCLSMLTWLQLKIHFIKILIVRNN